MFAWIHIIKFEINLLCLLNILECFNLPSHILEHVKIARCIVLQNLILDVRLVLIMILASWFLDVLLCILVSPNNEVTLMLWFKSTWSYEFSFYGAHSCRPHASCLKSVFLMLTVHIFVLSNMNSLFLVVLMFLVMNGKNKRNNDSLTLSICTKKKIKGSLETFTSCI